MDTKEIEREMKEILSNGKNIRMMCKDFTVEISGDTTQNLKEMNKLLAENFAKMTKHVKEMYELENEDEDKDKKEYMG